jgi:hypothetical protein
LGYRNDSNLDWLRALAGVLSGGKGGGKVDAYSQISCATPISLWRDP